jgi:hypothetical protein
LPVLPTPPPLPPPPPVPPALRAVPTSAVMSTRSTLPLPPPPRPLLRHDINAPVPLLLLSSPPSRDWHHHSPPLPTSIRPLPPIPPRQSDQITARPHEQHIDIPSQSPPMVKLSAVSESTTALPSTATPENFIPMPTSFVSSQTSLPHVAKKPRLLPFPRPVIVIPPRVIGESLPRQETVCKRVEECFPNYNMSAPVVEATQLTARGTPSPDYTHPLPSNNTQTRRKPSVREKRVPQPFTVDPPNTITRKNTTKLWITRYG